MIQAVLKQLKNIELENVERRSLTEGEVRLQVVSCAICGSDIRIYNYGNSRVKLPHVIGHEVVGKIIEVTDGCDLHIGDYCCFGADLSCGDSNCDYCSKGNYSSCNKNLAIGYQFDGGFAEEIIIPKVCWKDSAFRIIKPNKQTNIYKYSLVEPLACAVHGVDPMNLKESDRVLVFGGGPIGLMLADICYSVYKCRSVTIVELSDSRVSLIKRLFPKFEVVNNVSLLDKRYDVIFTANSSPECHKLAIDIAAKDARINLFGGLGTNDLVQIDTNKIHYKQLVVTGTHGSRKEDFDTAFYYIDTDKINIEKYITAVYSLNKINEAFESAKNLNNLKIIITPSE